MSMSFRYDDSGLKKLQKNLDEIKGEHAVPITDLMTDGFVSQHSNFNNFQALIDASEVKYPEEIGNDVFSKFVSTHTTFSSWDDMKKTAGTEYVKRKLGF